MSYWTSMLGGETRYIHVGTVRTRILEAGDADHETLIVLLHGAGGHAENFASNVVPLSAAGHVVAPDLLGHGLTARPPGTTYTFRTVLDHIKALIDTFAPKRVFVGGLSMGGNLAAHVARERKDVVTKALLICPVGVAGNDAEVAPARDGLHKMADNNIAGFDDGEDGIRKKLMMLVHNPPDFPEEMVTTRLTMYDQPGAKASMSAILRDLHEGIENPVVGPSVLRDIDADTLFIWGRKNFGSLETIEQAAAQMKHGRVAIFEHSGHWPHVVEQDLFTKTALDFLR
jgi:2-hydroxy-6-oxonona-2,4-dienedioate hydrolase